MKTQRRIVVTVVLIGVLLLASVVLAAPMATTLERYVIGGGGGHTEGGTYALDGTIGQAVVGTGSAGSLSLCSGYWCGLATFDIYLPLVMR